jgi:general secretion pathway protein G
MIRCLRCTNRRGSAGFTLVELVAALAILAVLASVSIAPLRLERQRMQERELRAALREIREALDAHKRLFDEGRIAKSGGNASGFPANLDDLAGGIVDASRTDAGRIYLLRRLPRDPFEADASMPAARTWALRSYSSSPDTPQPGADVFDVRSRAPGVGLNGVPYREW